MPCERELSALKHWQIDTDILSANKDDFEAFISATPTKLPFTNHGASGKRQLTVLEWWSQPLQRQSLLALSQLAIDVLSAFAMSAESEQIFSKARRTIGWSRSQLNGQTVRWLKLSKDWQATGVVNIEIDSVGVADSNSEAD